LFYLNEVRELSDCGMNELKEQPDCSVNEVGRLSELRDCGVNEVEEGCQSCQIVVGILQYR